MSDNHDAFLAANARYAEGFEKGDLPIVPSKHAAILTCMDARILPSYVLGFEEGDVHVIRNAGGRLTDDALRSFIISYKLLGTRALYIMHHTNCGMGTFTEEQMGDLLAESLSPAELTAEGWRNTGDAPGCVEGRFLKWHCFTRAEQALIDDVHRLRACPLIPKDIPVFGLVYEVETGRVRDVTADYGGGARA